MAAAKTDGAQVRGGRIETIGRGQGLKRGKALKPREPSVLAPVMSEKVSSECAGVRGPQLALNLPLKAEDKLGESSQAATMLC